MVVWKHKVSFAEVGFFVNTGARCKCIISSRQSVADLDHPLILMSDGVAAASEAFCTLPKSSSKATNGPGCSVE